MIQNDMVVIKYVVALFLSGAGNRDPDLAALKNGGGDMMR